MLLEHALFYISEGGTVFEPVRINMISYDNLNTSDFTYPAKWIFLKEGNTENEKMAAQAISLDIRGRFWELLNSDVKIWCGNQYEVAYSSEGTVTITNFLYADSEDDRPSGKSDSSDDHVISKVMIPIAEWNEALNDWKDFYLDELGFREFENAAMSHLFGVLIMVNSKFCDEDENFPDNSLIVQSIKDCANRYGICVQTIYSQCKNAIGVKTIQEFYNWVRALFHSVENDITDLIKDTWRPHVRHLDDVESVFRRYLDLRI